MKSKILPLCETLEHRELLSTTAVLQNGVLTVNESGFGYNAVTITSAQVVSDNKATVLGGTTSVYLNLPLLQQAAGLTLTGTSTDGRPASSGYQLGFPILPTSDFKYALPFSPAGGTIHHSGTVTFNNNVTVGNFDIAYNASRATNGRSGFYVASTTGVKAILFDLGAPGSVSATKGLLSIGRTPLLVSPEFAAFLGKPQLTGAQVGAATITAVASFGTSNVISVNSLFGGPSILFDSSAVKSIVVNAAGQSNSNTFSQLIFGGSLSINLSGGTNNVTLNEVSLSNLNITGASGIGSDTVSVTNSAIVTTQIKLANSIDNFNASESFFTGKRQIQAVAGSGFGAFDTAYATNTDLTKDAFIGWTTVNLQ